MIGKVITGVLAFMLGAACAWVLCSAQQTKVYEDGSFVGCQFGAMCRD